jgi:2-polyprenyl-3-methyl-5-hydroxy-6-metoxy-1,4-benzoquinol methylase
MGLSNITNDFKNEITLKNRFAFGDNWHNYLKTMNADKLNESINYLREMLGIKDLQGKKFIDIGSGSGIISLSARKLGAVVYSFDYDPRSVSCTEYLKAEYFPNDSNWNIAQGSILDKAFLDSLGKYDIIYSWGVLHHTGNLILALENTISLCKPDSVVYISLYNDQGIISKYWLFIKKIYNKHPILQSLIILIHFPYLFLFRFIKRLIKGNLSVGRGMNIWHDMIDWLGGFPFEVMKPTSVVTYFTNLKYKTIFLKTCGKRHGCNEYIFKKPTDIRN